MKKTTKKNFEILTWHRNNQRQTTAASNTRFWSQEFLFKKLRVKRFRRKLHLRFLKKKYFKIFRKFLFNTFCILSYEVGIIMPCMWSVDWITESLIRRQCYMVGVLLTRSSWPTLLTAIIGVTTASRDQHQLKTDKFQQFLVLLSSPSCCNNNKTEDFLFLDIQGWVFGDHCLHVLICWECHQYTPALEYWLFKHHFYHHSDNVQGVWMLW